MTSITEEKVQVPFFDFAKSVPTADNPMPEDQLILTRQGFTSSKDWGIYVKQNLPYLDTKEQIAIVLEENKKRDMANCGKEYRGKQKATLEHSYYISYCGITGCLRCDAYKKYQMVRRLEDLIIPHVIQAATEEEALNITKGLGKANYLKSPNPDGTFLIVVEGNTISNSQPLDNDLKEQITISHVEFSEKRISGNLGKAPSAPASAPVEPEKLTPQELLTNEIKEAQKYEAKDTHYKVIFNDKSTLKTPREIQTEVLKLFGTTDIDIEDHSQNNHLNIVEQLNKLRTTVCKDNSIEYKVVKVETVWIHPDEILWETFKDSLEKQKPPALS